VIRGATSAALAVTLLAVAALLPACSHAGPSAPVTSTAPAAKFTNVPAVLDQLRFVWTAAPGIDLETGVAVAVRGYYESRQMAELTADMGNVYPGFDRAVTYRQQSSDPDQGNNPSPFIPLHVLASDDSMHLGKPLWGNVHFRVLSITQPHNDVQAIVCIDDSYLYTQLAEADFQIRDPRPDFRLERIDLSNDPNSRPSPPALQRGPLPAPVVDVFGPWHVDGLSMGPNLPWVERDGTYTKTTPGAEQWTQQCHTDLPLPADQRRGAFPLKRDTPPPIEPFAPGWPGPGA
jgi:hypothetical protein